MTASSPLKIVISGPVGAGKTTYVKCLSESELVLTDELASEAIGKATTTVAMDFGCLDVEGQSIHLFGTPGQERFNFMWEVLCEGAMGLILLVSGDAPKDFTAARAILEFVTSQVPVPFVIGVTKPDASMVWEPEDVASFFNVPPEVVFSLDPRKRTESLGLLLELFRMIEAQDAV